MSVKELRKKVATEVWEDDIRVEVYYHDTCVLTYYWETGEIVLKTGGWWTVMTKRRINQGLEALKLPIRVHQKDWLWYVWNFKTEETIPFDKQVLRLRLDPLRGV